ncbi:MAG: hypothetical protein ACE5OV_01640 [Candidatus Bathyarchaeia archaeon]
MLRSEERAVVRCGSCGLTEEMPYKTAYKEIDVYCVFTDKYYSGIRTRK